MKQALVVAIILCVSTLAYADEVRVAAASDLNFAAKEIISSFEHKTGHKVALTLGSSGNFYQQILQGAPFQVFFSADIDYASRLESAGRVEPGSVFIYGRGRIVVWALRNAKVNPEISKMDSLIQPSVKKIAIANPEHAPYGRAAVAAMQQADLYERVRPALVLGENISQAAQFAQSGAADIGIIALSLAQSDPMKQSGRYWIIPQSMHPPLDQAAVLVKGATPAARAFYEWLKSPEVKAILQRYGFQ
jgi:molybdate transport system substrate-binding protein